MFIFYSHVTDKIIIIKSIFLHIAIKCKHSYEIINGLFSLQVQLENDKLRRDSRIDLSNLCVSSNAMRQHSDQKSSSTRVRNSNGLYIDSQGNSIPLSPVSSSNSTSSSSSDNVEHHKPVPMTPSGKNFLDILHS